MRNINFQVPGDLDAALKDESRRSGVPMSEILRRLLREHLEKRQTAEKAKSQ